ncbi:hypothetical protein [Roseibium sediminicola]|uniref:Uncharacterized protein n=1 Tax=Roseibium sediminicola TaxID=2933272 RepID=A0ABT0H0J7_9HYPH|nr:hypothetical protein [Roseibium sp. CAU 1639]MCK7615219.1 hypothetical protein [Roseibium sp. CAU 1639]
MTGNANAALISEFEILNAKVEMQSLAVGLLASRLLTNKGDKEGFAATLQAKIDVETLDPNEDARAERLDGFTTAMDEILEIMSSAAPSDQSRAP